MPDMDSIPPRIADSRLSVRTIRLAALIAALCVLALLTGTALSGEPEQADPGRRTLLPGDNLIGWVHYSTTPDELFAQIPEAELVYTWDAEQQRFRFAGPNIFSNLKRIEPGMGLVLRISGSEPVQWQQPVVADGEWVRLIPGPNLVAWTGPSDSPIDLAVRSIGDAFSRALYWMPERQELGQFDPSAAAQHEAMPTLQRGDALWIFTETESNWLQASGDRPLHRLGPPPDHLRWYATFDKYLDADGLAFMATENVADEALFRAAAIFDDLLVNRPDVRETLIKRREHIVVVGESEQTFDLAPYRQYRDLIKLEPYGPGGPRGLGPNGYTPTLVPEENLLCTDEDSYRGYDVAVHEFAHAIDFAVSRGPNGGSFRNALVNSYRETRESGQLDGTYAMTNSAEHWAEGVLYWSGLRGRGSYGITNRIELLQYVPSLANLVADTLGEFELSATCQRAEAPVQGATRMSPVEGTLFSTDGVPLADVRGRLELLDDSPTPGQTQSLSEFPLGSDGYFAQFAAPGDYRISFRWEHCPLYYRDDGLTIYRDDAQVVSVAGTSVEFNVNLPEDMCRQRVSGIIVDGDGAPARKVIRVIRDSSGDRATGGGSLLPDQDGRFAMRLPAPGRYRMHIYADGCWLSYDGESLVDYDWQILVDAERLDGQELRLTLPDRGCSE